MKDVETEFNAKVTLRITSDDNIKIRHLLSKHSLDWVICKLCGKVSTGLIFTLGTGIFNTFMFGLLVSFNIAL